MGRPVRLLLVVEELDPGIEVPAHEQDLRARLEHRLAGEAVIIGRVDDQRGAMGALDAPAIAPRLEDRGSRSGLGRFGHRCTQRAIAGRSFVTERKIDRPACERFQAARGASTQLARRCRRAADQLDRGRAPRRHRRRGVGLAGAGLSSWSGSPASSSATGVPIHSRSSAWSRRGLRVFGWTRMLRPPWLSISHGTRLEQVGSERDLVAGLAVQADGAVVQVPSRTGSRSATCSR